MRLLAQNAWTWIVGNFPTRLIDDETSYAVHGRWFAKSYRKGHWDGRKRLRVFDKRKSLYKFPTGLLYAVTSALDAVDYPYTLEDERTFEMYEPVYKLADGDRLDQGVYAFQKDVLDQALMQGRGIIKLATGAGKTVVGAAIIASFDQVTLWLTHRRPLLHQTRARLAKALGKPIGIIGDSECQIEPVTVCMVQSLQRWLKKLDEGGAIRQFMLDARVVIGDEIHHLESGKGWFDVFGNIHAPHRFGLTATPCTDGAGLHLLGMTGPIIAEVNADVLIKLGVLVQPRIWFLRVDEQLDPELSWQSAYSQGVVHSLKRNGAIVSVAKLLRSEEKNCITFVKRLNHGDLLADMMVRAGLKATFISGKASQEERESALESLWRGDLHHVVAQVDILGEGVDLPPLQAVINATGLKGGGSSKSAGEHEIGRGTIQILGRGLRRAPEKDDFTLIDVLDQSHPSLLQAARERVTALEDEGYGPWIDYWSNRPEMITESV